MARLLNKGESKIRGKERETEREGEGERKGGI